MSSLRCQYTLLLLVWINLLGFSASIDMCNLNENFHGQNLMSCSQFLLDKDEKMTSNQAFECYRTNKFLSKSDDINFNRNHHWISFTLRQDFLDELNVLIKFSDLRGAWVIRNDSLLPILYSGYLPDYHPNTIFKDHHRIVYGLKKGQAVTLLFKSYPKYFEHGPPVPHIYDALQYEQEIQKKLTITTFLNGIVLGIMALFLTIAILVFFFFREKAYLAYLIYLFFVITYLWRDFEYLNLYFFSSMKFVAWHETKLIMNCLVGTSYIFFVKYFMNTKVDFPHAHRMLNFLAWLLFIIIPVDYIGSEILGVWGYRVGIYFAGAIVLISQIFFNVYFIRSPDPMARYIVYGTILLAIGAISIPLFHVDIHTWIVRCCFILEIVFFTAALSLNIKKVRRAKTNAEEALKVSKIINDFETEIKLAKERELTADLIRNEISRDIHDEIGAELTKISLSSHLISKSDKITDANTKLKIALLGDAAFTAQTQLRLLLFSINPTYDHLDSIQAYFKEIAQHYFTDSHEILHFELHHHPSNPKMDRIVRSQLIMIYKEILTNIVKHAATKNIWIKLVMISPNEFELDVRDDGRGYDQNLNRISSSGIKNINDRCHKIRAKLSIVSKIGKGTSIKVVGNMNGVN